MMKVYIAEQGCYDERRVAGVFDSPERAMAVLPGEHWRKETSAYYPNFPDRGVVKHSVRWINELDWEDAVCIIEDNLVAEGPLRSPDEKVIQTYRESDGGWDYVPE